MGDVLESGTRCPHCRASIRPGAPWCTLCHADLRPAPEPAPAPPAIDPLTAPAEALGLRPADTGTPVAAAPTWPCSTCGATNQLAADVCATCGAAFLAALRETEPPLLELPGVGDLTRMSRGQRLAIAFGGVAAFMAVVALLTLLLG